MGGSEGGGVFHLSCVTSSVPGSLFRVGPSFLAATFGRGCFMWTCCWHVVAGWCAFSVYLLVCHSLLHNYRDGVFIRPAANVEEKLTRAANFYISDFATNKKDLQEVVDIITKHKYDKGGLLSTDKVHDAMLFFAHHKVPKSRMILLITKLSYLYPVTKVDAESLLLLLNNVNYVSQTEEDLTTNVKALEHCFFKARSTPSSLVKLLNEALPIAIENEIDFVLFTNTILTYLARGYAQTSIIEHLSRKFTKKIP